MSESGLRIGGVVATLAMLACAVAIGDRDAGLAAWWQLRAEVAAADSRVAALEREIAALEGEVAALRSDPLATERAIREELGLARPGEFVVRLVRPRPQLGEGSSTYRFH